jgi:hypothetical protein
MNSAEAMYKNATANSQRGKKEMEERQTRPAEMCKKGERQESAREAQKETGSDGEACIQKQPVDES